jgi:Ohr subfamily peroxiredoxin
MALRNERELDAFTLRGEPILLGGSHGDTINGIGFDSASSFRRQIMAILATETASATAGREGRATSADGKINVQISPPGSNGPGTNPEPLFATGYSACFGGAIGYAASVNKIPLKMADIKVTKTVRLHKDDDGFHIDAPLNSELVGIEQKQAEALVAQAHTICPYSKATRGI